MPDQPDYTPCPECGAPLASIQYGVSGEPHRFACTANIAHHIDGHNMRPECRIVAKPPKSASVAVPKAHKAYDRGFAIVETTNEHGYPVTQAQWIGLSRDPKPCKPALSELIRKRPEVSLGQWARIFYSLATANQVQRAIRAATRRV